MRFITFICVTIATLSLIAGFLLAWVITIASESMSDQKLDQLILYFVRVCLVFAVFSLLSSSLTFNRKQ